MDRTIKSIDLESLADAGRSTTHARWVTNPLRRGLWFLVRPYFRALADEVDRALRVAASGEHVKRGTDEAAEAASREESPVKLFVPAGHYYSPVVDPDGLPWTRNAATARLLPIPGIGCDMERMCATFSVLAGLVGDLDFPAERSADYRYFFTNDMFWCGGALVLAGMIRNFRPRMIIEVGSGFSSAAILDTLDRTPELAGTRCMFIEPNQGRLQAMLRSSDCDRVDIVPHPVQHVPLGHFEHLQAGDILFLDTTHVVKTGSDVVHEVFEILPRLKSGVLVHFHDVMCGFEYPERWIFEENRSWNEIYFLRAFLMYNKEFEIVMFTDQLLLEHRDLVKDQCPRLADHPDGGIWLRKL